MSAVRPRRQRQQQQAPVQPQPQKADDALVCRVVPLRIVPFNEEPLPLSVIDERQFRNGSCGSLVIRLEQTFELIRETKNGRRFKQVGIVYARQPNSVRNLLRVKLEIKGFSIEENALFAEAQLFDTSHQGPAVSEINPGQRFTAQFRAGAMERRTSSKG